MLCRCGRVSSGAGLEPEQRDRDGQEEVAEAAERSDAGEWSSKRPGGVRRCASGESSALMFGRRAVSRESSSPPATRWNSKENEGRR